MLKGLRRFLRAQALGALFALAGLLPLRLGLALGAWLGGLAFTLLADEREKALRHLAIAFPGKSDAERAALALGSFRQLGRSALEVARAHRLDLRTYVEWPEAQIAALKAALAGGTGGVLVFGHIGNWELVGPRMVAEGFGGVAIGRDSGDAHLARRIEAFRKRLGLPIVGRGNSSESLRGILRALKEGKLVAVLIDQDTRVESVFVPFFGRLANTPKAAEDLARLAKGVCVMAFIHRKPEGGHRLTTELVEGNAPELTARLTARLEAELRAQPEDWVWMHERWKRRPVDERITPVEVKRPPPELLARAVAAVRASGHAGGPLYVDESFYTATRGDLAIYFDDVRPADLPPGSVYKTFVVRFKADTPDPVGVSFYRTRVGPDGRRETLPP